MALSFDVYLALIINSLFEQELIPVLIGMPFWFLLTSSFLLDYLTYIQSKGEEFKQATEFSPRDNNTQNALIIY